MANQLNVSLVGCGGMAAHYLSVYRDLPWVRVVSCIDTDPHNAQRAAAIFGNTAPESTTDFEQALHPTVDTVVISTPNGMHAPQAIAALNAGKHVLLQKPIAATLSEAEAIERAAEASTKTSGLYMSYFDQPLIHDLRDWIQTGGVGDVIHCYARLMHHGGMMWSKEALAGDPTWRGSLQQTGGGCFIQLAVHYIHIFEWLTASKVVRATAIAANLHCPGLEGEDLASAILQTNTGALITLDTAWCTNGEELAVQGTRGRIHYRANRLALSSSAGEFHGRTVHYTGALRETFGGAEGEEQITEIHPPAFGDSTNPLNQHRAFLEAARDGQPAPVSIASGVRDMRIVAAVYESARTGRTVELQ